MRKTSLGELIANAVSHGVGVLIAIAMFVILVVRSNSTEEVLSSVAFGTAMIVLYLSSTLFHSFPEKMKKVYAVFQRFDHSAIFLLITGTYTPFIILVAQNTSGYVLLGALWLITITGIVFKSIWVSRFHYIHLALYVLMGWSVMLIWSDISPLLDNAFWYLLLGGISYTVGVAFYVSKFKFAHFVWHLFVLGGSILHFFAVWIILGLN